METIADSPRLKLASTGYYSDFFWLRSYVMCLSQNAQKEKTILPEPNLIDQFDDTYSVFVRDHQLTKYERLAITLALSPHLDPNFLQLLNLQGNPALLRQSSISGALLPTAETFLFLASEGVQTEKLQFHNILDTTHLFYRKSVLDVETPEPNFPPHCGVLTLGNNYRELFLYNRFTKPRFNSDFPAHLLETNLTWKDFIINSATEENLREIIGYVKEQDYLRQQPGFGKHMKAGCRALFWGASGTGKTLAVSLIGAELGRDVYRVDLSMVVSKYIGETSKNLNALFNTAEDKDWILFFDEGDAVFGKRTDASAPGQENASRYANQDAAFLLQRIENYNGLVIVATNFKSNLDSAFIRRFEAITAFSLPDNETATRIWKENVSPEIPLSPAIQIDLILKQHRFSAASIIKIIRRATLLTKIKGQDTISKETMEKCLRDESFNG
jgi:ATPase family associated with various cellular activities (AAA)